MGEGLVIAGRMFKSRLIVGTGKYPSHAIMKAAHLASGADMATVAVRRVDISRKTESLLDYIDTTKIFLLPNTAASTRHRTRFAPRTWDAKPGCRTG